MTKPSSTLIISRSPMVDENGQATFAVQKLFQEWDTKLANGLSQLGQITQSIPASTQVVGRTEGIGTTLHNIDSAGIVTAQGIDFSRAYTNKTTDNITDGNGSPLAGGKAAQTALVSNPPVPQVNMWLTGIVGGVFVMSQPSFSRLSGTATAAQLPALSALSGNITTAQLPTGLFTGTVVMAKITGGGSNGSLTLVNGSVSAYTAPT